MSKEIQIRNATEDVVVYRSADNAIQLDVQLAEETVWLTQLQMAMLFDATVPNISMHIRNIFKEEELTREATVKDFLIVQTEGGREVSRRVQCYNLDVIISVGYRVKSKRGTQFRQWANQVLKNYLLHGYAINNRFENLEQRVAKAEQQIEYFVRTSLPPREGIFVDGQIYDAFEFLEKLIKSAKKTILLIDNYVDESVLTMMSEKEKSVKVDIYTKEITKALKLAEDKFNSQYKGLSIHQTNNIHDRFLILDDQTIYLIGASLKDAGKKLFAFTEISVERIAELKNVL
ncbi:MAG: virulence RhuM family protein [Paludibacteraceae bacterium]|nr:virulence RhuM family protein [Paludibacteraceae bacterium]